MAASGGTRAVVAALFANLGIAVAKFAGFLITRSSSMLAEGVHSIADSTNQALLLLGGRRSRRPATTEHAFGFARERYFWSFVVSVVLFTLGSAFAFYEGIDKLRHPHEMKGLGWAIGILLMAIVLEGWSFRTAVIESNRLRGPTSWGHFVRHTKHPELPVVLLEDLGALVGLVIALVAVTLAEVTGEPRWDGAGTLVIGLLLGVIALVLAREMKSLLIGESAGPRDQRAIVEAIESAPATRRIIHLRTQHLGPNEILVAVKVLFDATLDTAGVAAAIDDVETRVRAVVPDAHPMYVEPALEQPLVD
ncbi:MAG: cation diffusion facilitator family transporter [Actinobacteria bacterium]|nr:cation diffusion facilitator family transporter [Actinomycetota bacterium]